MKTWLGQIYLRGLVLVFFFLVFGGFFWLFTPQIIIASEAIDVKVLRECIEPIESANVPYPDGAVVVETLPDGTQTVSRGRYQITETTLKQYYPKVHASWLANAEVSRQIMEGLLRRYIGRYPHGNPKRIAYAHFAGRDAEPYKRKAKEALAQRVAECYMGREK